MATDAQYQELVLLVGTEMLTEDQLKAVIDLNAGDMDASAAQVWEIRAGRYHGLVNISESGSSRSMGDLHQNAIRMAAMYRGKIAAEDQEASGARRSGTRAIRRPE
ncbi:MAG: hypothetical protein AB7L09_22215 [Nitrospira sp.]